MGTKMYSSSTIFCAWATEGLGLRSDGLEGGDHGVHVEQGPICIKHKRLGCDHRCYLRSFCVPLCRGIQRVSTACPGDEQARRDDLHAGHSTLLTPSLPPRFPVGCPSKVPRRRPLVGRCDLAQGTISGDNYGAATSCGSVKTKSCPFMGLWH